MECGKYAELRSKIVDGDIVFFKNGTSIWSKLTEKVTKSPYFHVGISFWMRDSNYESRLFLIEAHQGGRRIVTLSAYEQNPMDVISAPINWRLYSGDLIDHTGKMPYSLNDYVEIGLVELFKAKIADKDLNAGEVCSKMVAMALNRGGLMLPSLISPNRLYQTLLAQGFEQKLAIS